MNGLVLIPLFLIATLIVGTTTTVAASLAGLAVYLVPKSQDHSKFAIVSAAGCLGTLSTYVSIGFLAIIIGFVTQKGSLVMDILGFLTKAAMAGNVLTVVALWVSVLLWRPSMK
ncbi:hypothetical protein [Corynebacterium sp. H130]|uniref:hypothetical protein n=1 Tax=Corynebacterium sp. H130 TaxID=3133444 RepID=UPI00309A532C